MAAVYVNNLVVNAGSDFSQSFTLEGAETNSALDLTDYTVAAQMRKWAGSSSATTFTSSIIDPPTSGKILIELTATQTTNLKSGRYVYDIVIEDSFGVKNRVIEGMVLVTEGVTR
jgi:hypothetical protein